ncbi:MAG: response regulator [Campylobacterota bacterium]|nr:response regulator [Campylobacterota bacterium]
MTKYIKILYVEDDVYNNKTVSKFINRYPNVQLVTAFDGKVGLELYKEHYLAQKFDIIVTDIHMPDMDGSKMVEKIKSIDNSVIVIYTSGMNDLKTIIPAIKTRPNFFLTKPIELKELESVLNECIQIVYSKYSHQKSKQLLDQYKYIVDKAAIVTKTDINGVITYANDKFCDISQYELDELIGTSHNIVRDPDMPKELFENLWDTIQNKQVWKGEIKNKAKNGTSYYLDATIAPILNTNGEIDQYIALRHDITEKKLKEIELEEQRNKAISASKAKSEFLANMSHEIRTPLNAIMGFLDILKEETRNRKAGKYVDIIKDSGATLLNIIEDILDFSKIESGKLYIENIDFNPSSQFNTLIHLFDAKCSQKNITLILNIDKNIPKFINSDPLRIKQIISNLLSNAIKFTEKDKRIIVKIKYADNKLKVIVADEGKGIAKEKQSHIFKAFQQEDNSTTRKHGGTGLGLAICSRLIQLLNGELKLKSTINKGSVFLCTIPVKIGEHDKSLIESDKTVNFKDFTILLVEDNLANKMFMKVILKKLKLNFDIASDGIEAVEAFKSAKYDAILMDENMPNMNGIEATKLILEHEKQNNLIHTPIIALTANAVKGDRERFLNAGMDEYLTKPIDQKKLNYTLQTFLIKNKNN